MSSAIQAERLTSVRFAFSLREDFTRLRRCWTDGTTPIASSTKFGPTTAISISCGNEFQRPMERGSWFRSAKAGSRPERQVSGEERRLPRASTLGRSSLYWPRFKSAIDYAPRCGCKTMSRTCANTLESCMAFSFEVELHQLGDKRIGEQLCDLVRARSHSHVRRVRGRESPEKPHNPGTGAITPTQLEPSGSNLINVLHTLYTGNRQFKKDLNAAMKAAFGDEFEKLVFPPAADQRVQFAFAGRASRPRSRPQIFRPGPCSSFF